MEATVPTQPIAISIHAPREGGDDTPSLSDGLPTVISIHAPREGGDCEELYKVKHQFISIHAPREGGDGDRHLEVSANGIFQSTPPARGATAKMHSFTCGSLTNK